VPNSGCGDLVRALVTSTLVSSVHAHLRAIRLGPSNRIIEQCNKRIPREAFVDPTSSRGSTFVPLLSTAAQKDLKELAKRYNKDMIATEESIEARILEINRDMLCSPMMQHSSLKRLRTGLSTTTKRTTSAKPLPSGSALPIVRKRLGLKHKLHDTAFRTSKAGAAL